MVALADDRKDLRLQKIEVRGFSKKACEVCRQGVENVQLLRKNGDALSFDTFVTNVFEKQDGRWLIVSHQATPIFRQAK